MKQEEKISHLKKLVIPLLEWYDLHARQLPFRIEGNPYSIWISEIMLQQTRMEAVLEYYNRFIKELPTVYDLAQVEEEKLLKLWEGLGYYNRACNLKKAAMEVVEKYNGKLPDTVDQLISLPGIGPYTAGAIASIAYQKQVAAVDGNVLRVLSRYLASYKNIDLTETKKEFETIIEQIIPQRAGDFNQALMELGALVCIPNGLPFCISCPLNQICLGLEKGVQLELPIRNPKKQRKNLFLTVFIFNYQNQIGIQKRVGTSLLNGLWQLPNIERKMTEKQVRKEFNLLETDSVQFLQETKHIFTSTEWQIQPVEIKLIHPLEAGNFIFVSKEQLEEDIMLPTAFKKLLG